MEELLKLDITNLSYGALFVGLFIYTIKRNEIREDKLLNALDKIVPRLENIENKVDKISEKEGK